MEKRFYEIDLLRIIAALAVLLYHYTFLGVAANSIKVEYGFIAPASRYGFLGVNLFFIISGFVILNTALKKSAREFAVSRITRLYPTFWVCITLTFIAMLTIGGARIDSTLGVYLLDLTLLNYLMDVNSLDSVYWSLFYEISFYFLIFMLLISGQLKRIKSFLGIWLFLSLLFYFVNPDDYQFLKYFLMPNYSAYFIAGAVFFLVNKEGLDAYKTFLLIGSYILAILYLNEYLNDLARSFHASFNLTAGAVTVGLFYFAFYLISSGRSKRMVSLKITALGLMTYPLYLLHQNIGFILFNRLNPYVNKYALLIVISAFILMLSYAVSPKMEGLYARPFRARLINLLNVMDCLINAVTRGLWKSRTFKEKTCKELD